MFPSPPSLSPPSKLANSHVPKEYFAVRITRYPSTLFICLFVFACISHVTAANAKEPLKVFILAGQSNMVGHARAHTIATLLASNSPRDRKLLEMVLNEEHGLTLEFLEDQLTRAREIDAITGGIKNQKLDQMEEGPEKDQLTEKAKKLKEQHEAYKKAVAAQCRVSERVFIHSIADRNRQTGPLKIGCGGATDKIGPEYGFGLSIADKLDGPILLIKTSWGGKSLNYNFRPPSAGEYVLSEKEQASDKVDEIKANVSLNYRLMIEEVSQVLGQLGDYHPQYDETVGHELAGFVWFQGFNDQFSDEFRDSYQQNMVDFVSDIRDEFESPQLPFVIGVLGTPVTPEKIAENAVSLAQRAAAKQIGRSGGVVAVESYLHYSHYSNAVFQKGWPEHYHEWDTVGSDRPYHYLGSGAFFVRLGDAFANAIAELMAK